MKCYSVIVIFLFLGFVGKGQILKAHRGHINSDSSDYYLGNFGLNFNLNNRSASAEENIVFRGLTASADLAYVGKKHAYVLLNKINYFKSTGGPLVSNGYAHFRTNLLRKKKISYELYGQIQYDNGRNMKQRILSGGGIRLELLESRKGRLIFGLGAMYEHEKWLTLDTEDLILKDIPKFSSYLGGNVKITENVDLRLIFYYQSGYDRDSKVIRNRINGDFEMSIEIIGRLDFILSFIIQYEDRPIIPINNYVYSLSNGLKWNF